jgi:hypothetical protein
MKKMFSFHISSILLGGGAFGGCWFDVANYYSSFKMGTKGGFKKCSSSKIGHNNNIKEDKKKNLHHLVSSSRSVS